MDVSFVGGLLRQAAHCRSVHLVRLDVRKQFRSRGGIKILHNRIYWWQLDIVYKIKLQFMYPYPRPKGPQQRSQQPNATGGPVNDKEITTRPRWRPPKKPLESKPYEPNNSQVFNKYSF